MSSTPGPGPEDRYTRGSQVSTSAAAASLDAEMRALAMGLLRLAREGTGVAPYSPRALQSSVLNRSQAAGVALGHLISEAATQHAVWGGSELASASRRLAAMASSPAQDMFFYTDLRTMNMVSHAIEEHVIAQRLDGEVYAGFQRLALLRPQLPRYRALVESARYVCVYGLNDLAHAPEVAAFQHARLVRLVVDPQIGTGLEWFWFVVVNHPQLQTAMVAQHVEGDLFAPRQSGRRYAGIWTFNPVLVDEIVGLLRSAARKLYFAQ
jgi:DICT domain-containing protein